MDMKLDVADLVSRLNELFDTAERVKEDVSAKVDTFTEIRDGLEEGNSTLSDALSTLTDLESAVSNLDDLLNNAADEGIE